MAYTTIDDPSAYFQTTTYTGDGNDDRQVTNSGNSDLQPDWIWVKNRSDAFNHILQDTSRGLTTGGYLASNQTQVESGATTVLIKTATSNGFTVGTSGAVNANTDNLVAWQWKANGGTTSSNTDGSITSTVQANTTAGFSIVTYTGTGSNATVGHGLGKALKFLIVKDRDASEGWIINSQILTGTTNGTLHFNTDAEYSGASTQFQGTNPTSTVFSIGTAGNVNISGDKYVAYCFAEIQGYSKFGSYTGNDSTDGSFIYLGFSPALIVIKYVSGTAGGTKNWYVWDNSRSPQNVNDNILYWNTTDSEGGDSAFDIDILSNGFKLRNAEGGVNNAAEYIYMAFAEHPFVSSKGVPVTAR